MSELLTTYRKKIIPSLQKELSLKNPFAVSRLLKVVVNIGVGRMVQSKDEKTLEQVAADLAAITGQKPVPTIAKKAIASFKTRAGMIIGYKVTLRSIRMYDFLERLIKIALPRTRDFRGLSPDSVTRDSLTIGIKEHIVFPEVSTENVRNIFSFEVTVVSNAKNKQQALALFKALGFPFKK